LGTRYSKMIFGALASPSPRRTGGVEMSDSERDRREREREEEIRRHREEEERRERERRERETEREAEDVPPAALPGEPSVPWDDE
jgi:hypothetical protein